VGSGKRRLSASKKSGGNSQKTRKGFSRQPRKKGGSVGRVPAGCPISKAFKMSKMFPNGKKRFFLGKANLASGRRKRAVLIS